MSDIGQQNCNILQSGLGFRSDLFVTIIEWGIWGKSPYGLFKDTFSATEHTASNGWMTKEQWTGVDLAGGTHNLTQHMIGVSEEWQTSASTVSQSVSVWGEGQGAIQPHRVCNCYMGHYVMQWELELTFWHGDSCNGTQTDSISGCTASSGRLGIECK